MKEILKKIVIKMLVWESKMILKKYKPKIVAVTGSVGKTSAKDAIFTALSSVHHVRKSDKSYNSEIGLPLTIIGADNPWSSTIGWIQVLYKGLVVVFSNQKYPKWLVLEVGVGKPGDMKRTAGWISTDIVVATHSGTVPVHVEFFDTVMDLKEEEFSLINTLREGGLLLVNKDDEDMMRLLSQKNLGSRKVYSYSLALPADAVATNFGIVYDDNDLPKGVNFKVEVGGNAVPVFVDGGIGISHVSAPLLAILLSYVIGLPLIEVAERFRDAKLPPGRMRLVPGINGSMIVDDSYNSSPVALKAALDVLGTIKAPGRKILILGDMLELGKFTVEEHEKIGAYLPKGVDILITVGKRAKSIALAAIESKKIKEAKVVMLDNAISARDYIEEKIKAGDIVLVKGSQGARLERVTEAIMQEPGRAKELLPRQDEEWRSR